MWEVAAEQTLSLWYRMTRWIIYIYVCVFWNLFLVYLWNLQSCYCSYVSYDMYLLETMLQLCWFGLVWSLKGIHWLGHIILSLAISECLKSHCGRARGILSLYHHFHFKEQETFLPLLSVISALLFGDVPVAELFIETKGTRITHACPWGSCNVLFLFEFP